MKPITIEKTIVQAKSRTLKATWTVEAADDVMAQHGIDIGKFIQEEIDREILIEIEKADLKAKGWIHVFLKKITDIDNEWCNKNIKNSYRRFGDNWYFSDERDSIMFTLRWGSKHE